MCAIQEISARIGRVTGRGIAGNLKQHYPAVVVYALILLLIVANVINLGADLGAMGAALQMVIGNGDPAKGGPELLYVAAFGVVIVLLEVFVRYARYVVGAEVADAGAVRLCRPWRSSCRRRGRPWPTTWWSRTSSLKADYFTVVVAILGTTISPYLFFWQAEEEVEEVKERARRRSRWSAPRNRPHRRSAASGSTPTSAWRSPTSSRSSS